RDPKSSPPERSCAWPCLSPLEVVVVFVRRRAEDQLHLAVGRRHAVHLCALEDTLGERIDEEHGRSVLHHHLIVIAGVIGDQHPLSGRVRGHPQPDLCLLDTRGLLLLEEPLLRAIGHSQHRSFSLSRWGSDPRSVDELASRRGVRRPRATQARGAAHYLSMVVRPPPVDPGVEGLVTQVRGGSTVGGKSPKPDQELGREDRRLKLPLRRVLPEFQYFRLARAPGTRRATPYATWTCRARAPGWGASWKSWARPRPSAARGCWRTCSSWASPSAATGSFRRCSTGSSRRPGASRGPRRQRSSFARARICGSPSSRTRCPRGGAGSPRANA